MAYWSGSQEQPPIHNKYGTVPARYFSHAYQEKQHRTNYQEYSREHLAYEPSCWTLPRSQTGGVLQDYTNWADTAALPNFPFTLESQSQSQISSVRAAQERKGREWLPRDIPRSLRERQNESVQGSEGQAVREWWDSYSPVHYRKDGAKRSLSDSSYRELEAWATRYSHSLPRKKRIESAMWGGAQGPLATEKISDWMGRSYGTEAYQRPANITRLPPQKNNLGHCDGYDVYLPPPYIPPPGIPNQEAMSSNIKENAYTVQRRPFSLPPCYITPPPYSNQSARVHLAEKHVKEEVMSVANTSDMLPAMRRPNYDMITGLEGADELQRRDTHVACTNSPQNEQIEHRPWKGTSGTLQPQIHGTVHAIPTSSDVPTNTNTKIKKRRGGETVFCLVSRMGTLAGLSSSPEDPLKPQSLPLFVSPLAGVCEGTRQHDSLETEKSQKSPHPADEVDSEVLITEPNCVLACNNTQIPLHLKHKPKGSSNWMDVEQAAAHREELLRAIQKCGAKHQASGKYDISLTMKNNEYNDQALPDSTKTYALSPKTSKKATELVNENSVKFPLWREPKWHCQSQKSAEQTSEANSDISVLAQDFHNCPNNVRQSDIREGLQNDSNGFLVIDTTCVVVKVEFICPPKKEHVQYVSCPYYGSTDPDPVGTSETVIESNQELMSNVSSKDDTSVPQTMNNYELGKDQEATENTVENMLDAVGDESCNSIPYDSNEETSSSLAPVKETLEERAVRILGLPLQNGNSQTDVSQENPCIQEQLEDDEISNQKQTEIIESTAEIIATPSEESPSSQQSDDESVILEETKDLFADQISVETDRNVKIHCEEAWSGNAQGNQFYGTDVLDGSTVDCMPVCQESVSDLNMQSLLPLALVSLHNSDSIPSFSDTSRRSSSPQCLLDSLDCLLNSNAESESPPESVAPCSSHITCPSEILSLPVEIPDETFQQILSPTLSDISSVSRPPSSPNLFPATSVSQPHCPSSNTSSPLSISPPQHLPPLSLSSTDPLLPPSPLQSIITPSPPSSPLPVCLTELQICDTTLLPAPLPTLLTPQVEGPQYPKSLWDAVNRIRKHTAPDSENEEEETVELWEQFGDVEESTRVCGCESSMDLNTLRLLEVASSVGYSLEASCTENTNHIVNGLCFEEHAKTNMQSMNVIASEDEQNEEDGRGQEEDDTLSCSSSDSHASRDTVIMGEGEESASETEGEEVSGDEADLDTPLDKEDMSEVTENLMEVQERLGGVFVTENDLETCNTSDIETCNTLELQDNNKSSESDSEMLADQNKEKICCSVQETEERPSAGSEKRQCIEVTGNTCEG
ncbi:uncharacterized protein LOC114800859 [Denticeps clupeoides]|uniref:uncharacterized protein LOC114800859 n=1 Tax=Denticeps clupeoides TaxID=299321 RepID=UPI0010A4203B|nr:uncharacterized protein LOC114800859 [Denticeps clupeoides]